MKKMMGTSLMAVMLGVAGIAYAGGDRHAENPCDMGMEHSMKGDMHGSDKMGDMEMSDHSMQDDMKPKKKPKDGMMMHDSEGMHGDGMQHH